MEPSRPPALANVKEASGEDTPRERDGAARALLGGAFRAAVEACQPGRLLVPELLPRPITGRVVLVGAGKAAIGMASAVLHGYATTGERASVEGIVIAPAGAIGPDVLESGSGRVEVRRGSHPVPDGAGVSATIELVACLAGLAERDTLVSVWSGGGSALLCEPRRVTLEQKQEAVASLLRSGASIGEINIVRKHLSAVKGGQLVRKTGAGRIVSYVLSDVVGDDLSAVASGPTVPDPSTFADALAVLDRYRLDPPGVRALFRRSLREGLPETPKPGDPSFRRVRTRIVGCGRDALNAAVGHLAGHGVEALVADARLEARARDAASQDARRARALRPGGAFATSGECTVEVKGRGRGGRNLEYLLALALALEGEPGVWALAADTDGQDGTSDAAGAVLAPDTLARAAALGLDPAACLAANDAHGFFEALGDLVRTGPTGTNVNDLHIVVRPA